MALRAGRVGVNPADVNPIDGHISSNYKEGVSLIGNWIDGKTLYRKVIITTSPSTTGTPTVVDNTIKSNEVDIVNLYGIITNTSGAQLCINGSLGISTHVASNGINVYTTATGMLNSPMCIIVEYTKIDTNTLNEE